MKTAKHLFTTTFLVLSCLFLSTTIAFAQGDPGTDDDGFIVEIVSPPSIAQLLQNTFTDCGWFGSVYGPSVTEELCGEVVWPFPDSIACNPLPPGSLTGKIALIRRGACSFSLKGYHAQEAGAKAVIIANHYNNPIDGPCFARIDATTYLGGMLGIDSADRVNIPSVFIQRQTAEQIDAALAAGEKVEVCFGFPSMLFPTTAYHYATPVSQVDTLDHIGVIFVNREPNTLYNVGLTAVIEEPDGKLVALTTTVDSAETGVDNLVQLFPAYLPPAVKGKFKVTYANDVYTSARDTVVAFFEHTDYSFAADKLVIRPGGISNDAAFAAANYFTQYGTLCLTNDSGSTKASHASFGLTNAQDLYIPNPFGSENDIYVYLYDVDIDEDGVWEFTTNSTTFDDIAGGLIAYGIYQVKGTEAPDVLITVPLEDLIPAPFPVFLKPNHPYFVSIAYDGVAAGIGVMPRFSISDRVNYLDFPSVRLQLDQMYGGWNGAAQILHLHVGSPVYGVVSPAVLNVDIQLLPNPAVDVVKVNLDFLETTQTARVSLMNGLGQILASEQLRNFKEGQITFDVHDLASGAYLLSVRTPEGVAIRQLAVCH